MEYILHDPCSCVKDATLSVHKKKEEPIPLIRYQVQEAHVVVVLHKGLSHILTLCLTVSLVTSPLIIGSTDLSPFIFSSPCSFSQDHKTWLGHKLTENMLSTVNQSSLITVEEGPL